jgi:hypothetical protein
MTDRPWICGKCRSFRYNYDLKNPWAVGVCEISGIPPRYVDLETWGCPRLYDLGKWESEDGNTMEEGAEDEDR